MADKLSANHARRLDFVAKLGAMGSRAVLFASESISVVDFRCTEHGDKDGPEEPNGTHSIALIRRGIFRRSEWGRPLVADANHILFFNEAQPYRYAHPVAGGDDCTILTIATPLALQLVAPRDAERPHAPFRLGHALISRRTACLHYELLALLRQRASDLAVEDALAELADEAVRDAYATDAPVRPRHRELTEAAKLALNKRLASPPSLPALARSFGCSPFHLSRVFHATAGVSLRRYLGRLRAGIAADQLARGADDLTDLALSLGYTDHSHFTNAFRQEFGVAPSQFRARHRRSTR
jgi:AraC-like DNA-binding protein